MHSTRLGRVLFLAALWVISATAMSLVLNREPVRAAVPGETDPPARASVVVQLDDAEAIVRQITFTTPISGLRALELSGLDLVIVDYDWGTAVCSIEGVGCPADNCFCNSNLYWGYHYWDQGAGSWQSYQEGATTTVISQTGAVEGWRWGAFGSTLVPGDQVRNVPTALAWLKTQQQENGGFGSPGMTAEAQFAAGVNRQGEEDWVSGPLATVISTAGIMDYWSADDIPGDDHVNNAAKYAATGAAYAGKLILSALASGQDPQNFAGIDLVEILKADYDSASGSFGGTNWDQALAILAWQAALGDETAAPFRAVAVLSNRLAEDGSLGYTAESDADTNSTSLAIQALRAAGVSPCLSPIRQALDYLAASQNPDGGFPYVPGSDSDTNSTAYGLMALLAAGEDPVGERWMVDGKSAATFLLNRQLEDGSFEWLAGEGSNIYATAQAIPALLHRPLVPAAAPERACHDTYLPAYRTDIEP